MQGLNPLKLDAQAADVAAGAKRYGAAFLRAYNRQRPYASHRVARDAAWLECGRQPHEVARRARESERYARKHGIRSAAPTCAPAPRRWGAQTRGTVRAHVRRRPGASSRTSSTDPGDSGPGLGDDSEPAGHDPRLVWGAR